MKRSLILLFVIIGLSSKAQNIDPISGKYVVERVVEYQASKIELYDKAITFLATNLGSANDAIQVRDKEGGRIITKVSVKAPGMEIGTVSAKIIMLFKDGKYKFTITDFNRDNYNIGSSQYKGWQFEETVTFLTHYVTKKDQQRVRDESFEKYLALMETMKRSFSKKDDF